MNRNKINLKLKKAISTLLATTIYASTLKILPITADNADNIIEKYPYTMFAYSSEENSISIDASNVCINGNIATNGTVISTGNMNINGTKSEKLNEKMPYLFDKIEAQYFSGSNVDEYIDDYFLNDVNININAPLKVEGELELTGNINLTTGIKAVKDVNFNGEVKNTNQSAICSETGDIVINTTNLNLNGLVYAPQGSVEITAQNLNMNSIIIIADKIHITCPNLNANYNNDMASFIGTEPSDDPSDKLKLIAYSNYLYDEEVFELYWNASEFEGNFEIKMSDNGIDYTSIGNVSDTDFYEFTIPNEFKEKYIKVVQTTNKGETCESLPLIIKYESGEYNVEFIDTDNDGLQDIYEIRIDTDINNIDTDEDGLTDYEEFYTTSTDPLVYDSYNKSVSDAYADCDEDGINNINELVYSTDPLLEDTDMDDLTDYDELFVYNTNPLVADTDNDGIDDGSEIKLGLNPNNEATNGTPDGKYAISQSISSDTELLSSINTEESPYSLSIDIKTNGDAEKEFDISTGGYCTIIENDAMIGCGVDISISDSCNPEEIVLKYDIKEEYIENSLNIYSELEEFKGLKRLNIFRFDEELNMLLPVETEFDTANNTIYTKTDKLGTYCIMDMEIWLNNLGIKMPENKQMMLMSSRSGATVNLNPVSKNNPIDLVFFLQTTGGNNYDISTTAFEKEKETIKDLSYYVLNKYDDVNIQIIKYDAVSAEQIYSTTDSSKLSDYDDISDILDNIDYDFSYSGYSNRETVSFYINNRLTLRDNSDRFIYHLINSTTNGSLYSDFIAIDYAENNKATYSHILPTEQYFQFYEEMNNAVIATGGLELVTSSYDIQQIYDNFDNNLSAVKPSYEILIPTKWKKITLAGELSSSNGIDTDEDTLSDWNEVDVKHLILNSDGNYNLPTFNIADLVTYVKRFKGEEYSFLHNDLNERVYLPIISDPTMQDSDMDGLLDDKDREPLVKYDYSVFSKRNVDRLDDYYKQHYESKDYDGNASASMNVYAGKASECARLTLSKMIDIVNECPDTDKVSFDEWIYFCKKFNSYVKIYDKVDEELHYFRNKLNRTPSSFQELIDNKSDWFIYSKSKTGYHMNNGYYKSSNVDYTNYSSYNNEYNMKFVDKYGLNEVIVSPKDDIRNMTHDEIYEYLTKAENWVILTDDINNQNPNFRYDPVNMGTYNYCASLPITSLFATIDIKRIIKSGENDSIHEKYDVSTFRTWGNIRGFMYGTTKEEKTVNIDYYDNNANKKVYDKYWEGVF